MSVSSSIKGAASSEHAIGALYIALIAFVLADAIPTPADAITLTWQRNLRDKWKAGTISAASFWRGDVAAYYLPNILWWTLVFFIVVAIPGSAKNKLYVALGVIGAGIVIGVVYNLYKKDERQQLLDQSLSIPKQ